MRRIWHPWTVWECYRAGMFDGEVDEPENARAAYASFLRDTPRFEAALDRVLAEWPRSCEHFLSNPDINRIAWLGQASMCIETGINCTYRGGFYLLTEHEQTIANRTAEKWLHKWILTHETQDRAVREDVEEAGLLGGHPGRSTAGVDDDGPGAVLQGDLFRAPTQ